ncbi:Activating signal cointegrator 1 complex subunit 1 [Acipenser ruthenus]|uniref:Activating signal cointegrator 1 complex subunit 1 n=1 Tax=Acipenser ruthenus TaxID=7906 RepID=A0A444UFD2_ACIRT|nr:Activating signal cointegrator 1 complex subunit 1 [Acipenser ruthenus]
MDVLRPSLININGRIYRKNITREQTYQNEEEDFDYSGRNDLQIITGQQRASVISACTRIEVLMESFRMKQPFTHFLSFALNQPEIQERYLQFKEEVLKNCSQDSGVDGSIFQNPAKLHLTIGTLSLLNEKEVTKACELLQQCKEDFIKDITGSKPLPLEIVGIEYMNDDPAMVDVLYAKVHPKDGSDKLQLIADQLVKNFVSSGLMTKEWDRVKLHATVMNTVFRKDPSAEDKRDSGRQGLKDRESFDARNLMKTDYRAGIQVDQYRPQVENC